MASYLRDNGERFEILPLLFAFVGAVVVLIPPILFEHLLEGLSLVLKLEKVVGDLPVPLNGKNIVRLYGVVEVGLAPKEFELMLLG